MTSRSAGNVGNSAAIPVIAGRSRGGSNVFVSNPTSIKKIATGNAEKMALGDALCQSSVAVAAFPGTAKPPLPIPTPSMQHPLFVVETKPFRPSLEKGLTLDFQLRANPVITRNKKRHDVMMDAKLKAKTDGEAQERWWQIQQEAAQEWLEKQGNLHGFHLVYPDFDNFARWAGPEFADSNTDVIARSVCVSTASHCASVGRKTNLVQQRRLHRQFEYH
jgi:uncharacterized membrane protein